MTVEELKIELDCYKLYFNPDCDVENLSLEEWAEFLTVLAECNKLFDTIYTKPAPILRLFE